MHAPSVGEGLQARPVLQLARRLQPSLQGDSLRYALVFIGVINFWAAIHYLLGARSLRQDLDATERLAPAAAA